jgi:hypothetical protein
MIRLLREGLEWCEQCIKLQIQFFLPLCKAEKSIYLIKGGKVDISYKVENHSFFVKYIITLFMLIIFLCYLLF